MSADQVPSQPAATVPAPPAESFPEADRRTQVVADALTLLGQDADPRVVAEHVRGQGIDLSPEEVLIIRGVLLERASTPPGPDQPPPQEARRRTDVPLGG